MLTVSIADSHLVAGTTSLLQAFKGALDDRLSLCPGADSLTQQVEDGLGCLPPKLWECRRRRQFSGIDIEQQHLIGAELPLHVLH